MFRGKHLDTRYADHCLFTEMFGDSTLKPYRPFISGIFQAYPTTHWKSWRPTPPSAAAPLQHKVLLPERLDAKPMTQTGPTTSPSVSSQWSDPSSAARTTITTNSITSPSHTTGTRPLL